jgi:ribosomal protein S6--L-glutamate ligase
MNIAILSRGPQLYSTQSLFRAGIKRGHQVQIIDHTRCDLLVEKNYAEVLYDNFPLGHIDAIIPRIGASVTTQGAALINHFETMNVFTVARSSALLQARDKLRCIQKLARFGIDVPRTVFVNSTANLHYVVEELGGLPVVIKLLEGTHGIGVILSETISNAEATVEAFHRMKQKVFIQEFIEEAGGADLRAIVINGEIVAAMKRQARPGEFRSNLHRGASSELVKLTAQEAFVAKKAVRIMGLDVAGVDLLRSARGPLVMEVNASPGLEGIETTTGIDIAGKIIDLIEKKVRKQARERVKR